MDDYFNIGDQFNYCIESASSKANLNISIVQGGGYAYKSVKYNNNNTFGDLDFMIIIEHQQDIESVISSLIATDFKFQTEYLELDLSLLYQNKVDLIRLSGYYKQLKASINIVPLLVIKSVCTNHKSAIIRKISHKRNTGIFVSKGIDGKALLVNFFSPTFITDDNKEHYIHLDFSIFHFGESIYFGNLSDRILKGTNCLYDKLGFKLLRKQYIEYIKINIKHNNLFIYSYQNMLANCQYFSDEFSRKYCSDFGQGYFIKNDQSNDIGKMQEPFMFCLLKDEFFNYSSLNINNYVFSNYLSNQNRSFYEYIIEKQYTEDYLYIYDAFSKFLSNTFNNCLKQDISIYNHSKCSEYCAVNNYFSYIYMYGENEICPMITNDSPFEILIMIFLSSNNLSNEIDERFKKYFCSLSFKVLQILGVEGITLPTACENVILYNENS